MRARALMPSAIVLAPGFGTQGAGARDAVASARPDGLGVIVNASRSLMYAFASSPDLTPPAAARHAAAAMRDELNHALSAGQGR